MLFSIIVPIYNSAQYLERCLLSILHQSFQNFELILIDDGSTDVSGDICDRYKIQYSDKIIVKHQKNSGALLSRCNGINIARGEFLLFVDSDDYLLQDALYNTYDLLQSYQCDIILYDYETSDGKEHQYSELIPNQIYDDGKLKKKAIYELLCTGRCNTVWNKMIRKEIIDIGTINYIEYAQVFMGEDLLQSMSWIINADRIVYMNKILYHYTTDNNNSITKKYTPELYDSIKKVHLKLYSTFSTYPEYYRKLLLKERLLSICDILITMLVEKKYDLMLINRIAEDDFFLKAWEDNILPIHIKAKMACWLIFHKQTRVLCICGKIYVTYYKMRNIYKRIL